MDVGLKTHKDDRFNPYSWNGGSVIAVAGDNYAILASDLRLSEGYLIHSRNTPKILKLSQNVYICTVGFHGDVTMFIRVLRHLVRNYEIDHKRSISLSAAAQMISNNLYFRRFFPYYIYVILAGIDDEGRGAVYSYDPIGSFERVSCRACGSGAAILQPILDNQFSLKNQLHGKNISDDPEAAYNLIKDAFISATERDIYTGDGIFIAMITGNGDRIEQFGLRAD